MFSNDVTYNSFYVDLCTEEIEFYTNSCILVSLPSLQHEVISGLKPPHSSVGMHKPLCKLLIAIKSNSQVILDVLVG